MPHRNTQKVHGLFFDNHYIVILSRDVVVFKQDDDEEFFIRLAEATEKNDSSLARSTGVKC